MFDRHWLSCNRATCPQRQTLNNVLFHEQGRPRRTEWPPLVVLNPQLLCPVTQQPRAPLLSCVSPTQGGCGLHLRSPLLCSPDTIQAGSSGNCRAHLTSFPSLRDHSLLSAGVQCLEKCRFLLARVEDKFSLLLNLDQKQKFPMTLR